MSRELATMFLPATVGELVKNHAPGLFYVLFPDWAAERCPMPSVHLQVPGVGAVTLFWPVAALVIVAGFVTSGCLGTRTLLRVIREGDQSRQGMFLWAASLLWYSCMCIGGLFFHCLHVYAIPHMLDFVGTGLASLSVIGGFAAFEGKVDDRTVTQRLGWVACAVAFAAVTILSPPLVGEQLSYVVPSLLATVTGMEFIRKHWATLQKSKVAKRWLVLSALGVGVALAMVSVDKWLCAIAGANLAFLLWFFLGGNVTILSTHLFALEVANNNVHFTNVNSIKLKSF